ncbi:MAG: AI-2E family transporter [Flavobacteriales bacterium]|nr:AI-2E family transporter [Flavobacteriales bacterium]
MELNKIAYTLIVCIASVFILIYLESILIPFVFAIIIWFLIKEFRQIANKLTVVNKYLPDLVLNLVAFVLIFGMIAIFSKTLTNNISQLMDELPKYKTNTNKLIEIGNGFFGVDLLNEVRSLISNFDFTVLLRGLFDSLSVVLGDIFLVILYVIFLLFEEAAMPNKLKGIFPDSERFQSARNIFQDIDKSFGDYIVLKTAISLITGVLSYIALLFIGVDFPMFWAILIFLLNYIPTIGSLIATVFPALTALLQFGEAGPFIMVLGCIGAIQLVVGNFIEPKLMGNSLNVSSLVVLLSLAFWGLVWGIVGMILCVPITVVMIILFGRFEATRPIAILLSGTGKIM